MAHSAVTRHTAGPGRHIGAALHFQFTAPHQLYRQALCRSWRTAVAAAIAARPLNADALALEEHLAAVERAAASVRTTLAADDNAGGGGGRLRLALMGEWLGLQSASAPNARF